jgi:hypothetical protein
MIKSRKKRNQFTFAIEHDTLVNRDASDFGDISEKYQMWHLNLVPDR